MKLTNNQVCGIFLLFAILSEVLIIATDKLGGTWGFGVVIGIADLVFVCYELKKRM